MMRNAFKVKKLKCWTEIGDFAEQDWIFRGEARAQWNPKTSFDRCCDRNAIKRKDRPTLEKRLVREFRRTYHLYAQHVPDQESTLEWLALMQHHGAPTRLLDFSYSIYVAAYFALENAE